MVLNAPPICGIIGKRGAGKTLLATKLVRDIALSSGMKVFSNYKLNIPNVECAFMDSNFMKAFFSDKKESGVNNCIVVIDEMSTFLSSYESVMTKKSRKFNTFAQQSRKRGIILFYTQQTIRRVPAELRRLTDYMIYPQYYPDKDYTHYIVYEWDGEVKTDIKDEKILYRLSDLFGMYDTKEIIEMVDFE